MAEGIVKRHSKGCPTRAGKRCKCNAGYEAFVYSPRDGKKGPQDLRAAGRGEIMAGRCQALGRPGDVATPNPPTWERLPKAG